MKKLISRYNFILDTLYPGGKITKKQSEGVRLSKYTPTDCFFGDFAHWDASNIDLRFCKRVCYDFDLFFLSLLDTILRRSAHK